ncbi:MAG: glucuronate isomerase [Clostridia bacterium]|nr:glucuronate isomerase [Clostridia bacterium]
MAFMDKDFLLNTPTARKLYHEVAAACPIIDYHCHINPREIYEDRRYDNIFQVWLGGDHYKWRLMRCAGVDEKYITGDAPEHDKFLKWAEVIGKGIGNPLYHWTHLELRNFFGYQGLLNKDTAEEVWNLCNAKLQEANMSVRGLIEQSNVELICTTDDPIDTLEWHQKLAADKTIKTQVLPAWRPDKAMNIEKPDFADYIAKLAAVSGIAINTWEDLKAALVNRMDYFTANGCCLSDHGVNYVTYNPAATDEKADEILRKRLAGGDVDALEVELFKTQFMVFIGAEYAKCNWTMQLHYGCRRDNNEIMYGKLGPDTGYDCINNFAPVDQLAGYLNALAKNGNLPKTIIYSLNPGDDQAIDTICGCFQSSEAVSKVQHGSAWWFNDNFTGMTNQLTSLGNLGYLAGFVGMLTDSRSFLSYPRHEYFRRILCRLIGQWVEDGFYPDDEKALTEIVRGISYQNAKNYFGFAEKK